MGNYREEPDQPISADEDGVIIEGEVRAPMQAGGPNTPPGMAPGPSQGEVARYAPGGGVIPAPAGTAGQFVDLLEDGQLSHEMHGELKQLAANIKNVARATGGKAKGSITLKLDLSCEGDAFHVQGKITTKAPELPRRRSIMWQDDSSNFTRFPPNQTQMFGTAPIRRVG